MSLRDWFAGQAMAARLSTFVDADPNDPDEMCLYAYEIADAMLKARREHPSPPEQP